MHICGGFVLPLFDTVKRMERQYQSMIDFGGGHRWELPVIHYHKIMVI